MNASDIVKTKQSQTLYRAYSNPRVFQSTVFSTITPVSSILQYTSSSVWVSTNSFVSCVNTVNTYSAQPTFLSYDLAQSMKDGAYVCGNQTHTSLQWKNTQSTMIYAFSSIYSSFATPNISTVSTIQITSSIVQQAPGPKIVPLIQFYQGVNNGKCDCNLITSLCHCNPNSL